MKRRKKLTMKAALEDVRLATRVAREWEPKRVLRALRAFARAISASRRLR